ncbi:MAG: hypothetical protein LBG89_02235 [Rickettsiales bacterium]|jgi:hypothetical protein|nr:hypothetical protein [Rickettsiales bacterium]
MKKIILSLFAPLIVSQSFAMTPLDPAFSPSKGDFVAYFSPAFIKPDLGGLKDGSFVLPMNGVAYGVDDRLSFFLEQASQTNPAIGIDYTLIPNREFSLDLIGKYELNVADIAATGGAQVYGVADSHLSWSASAFVRYRNIQVIENWFAVDILLQGRVLYQLDAKWGVFAEFNYNVIMDNYDNLYFTQYTYSRDMTLGAVYAISKSAAVMPFVSRNFKSVMSYGGADRDLSDGAMSVGARFGVQF